jgi:CheY-like chemotaxis protein
VVLFVDDEPRVLHGYRDSLRKEPYDILTASSALLAQAILGRSRVDIVISDERMPGMSGSELLALVHRDNRAHSQRNCLPDRALESWQALGAGGWCLVERFEADGRVYLIARPNKLEPSRLPRLTPRERAS